MVSNIYIYIYIIWFSPTRLTRYYRSIKHDAWGTYQPLLVIISLLLNDLRWIFWSRCSKPNWKRTSLPGPGPRGCPGCPVGFRGGSRGWFGNPGTFSSSRIFPWVLFNTDVSGQSMELRFGDQWWVPKSSNIIFPLLIGGAGRLEECLCLRLWEVAAEWGGWGFWGSEKSWGILKSLWDLWISMG